MTILPIDNLLWVCTMEGFEARERAAEAFFAHDLEEAFLARISRVRSLGDWANHAMAASPGNAAHYQDILHRIALCTADDRIIIERLRDDLAAAGVFLTSQRLTDMLAYVGDDR